MSSLRRALIEEVCRRRECVDGGMVMEGDNGPVSKK
jgi:hypothetical protein